MKTPIQSETDQSSLDQLSQPHPDAESLAAFSDDPDASEHKQTGQHLAQCPQCRQLVEKLSRLSSAIQQTVPAIKTNLSEQESLQVTQYVDGELDAKQSENIGRQLQQDKNLLKAALHYSLHSAVMSKKVDINSSSESVARVSRNNFNLNFWQKILAWRPPVWETVPVTAMLVIVIMTTLSGQQAAQIAVYQDDPVMYFQKATQAIPGIGFFNAARESEIKYGKVLAQTDKQGSLTMQWPAIKNANKYSVSIYKLAGIEKVVVGYQETVVTTIIFQDLKLKPNRNYHWQIKGSTSDGQIFHTDGGLVVTQ